MRKVYIISLIFIAAVIAYTVMLIDTNNVVDDFKNTIRGIKVSESVANSAFSRYDIKQWGKEYVENAKIDVKRIFVIHNFSRGIMFVNYSYERYDDNGRINGAWNCPATWYIRKENGRWIVYDIDESP